MKILKLTIAFVLATLTAAPAAMAQKEMSIGGLVGASSYIGDFNPGGVLYKPAAYFGGLIHYDFTEYYSVRVNLGGGTLRGDPAAYKGRLMPNVLQQQAAAFNQRFFDAEARLVVGFLPYEPFEYDPKKRSFAPYFAVGMGMAYSRGAPFLVLPVAVGAKYRVAYRITLGAEWTFRKTFNDNLDGWENVRTSSAATINNNDWISYVGVFLTYQLSDKGCCHE
ncbi:MAG: DUF6089 family protein [Prevotellaceae bacterium]|jgi:hypothetical protein|nr:DUF6089 family protein [Prevotellaceae bacterium]